MFLIYFVEFGLQLFDLLHYWLGLNTVTKFELKHAAFLSQQFLLQFILRLFLLLFHLNLQPLHYIRNPLLHTWAGTEIYIFI